MDAEHDTHLMLRLQSGDDGALNELMTRWQTPLIRFIYRYVGDQDEALDLAQETFVRIYQNRAGYRASAKFSSWLFTIASNLCRNSIRWKLRHPTVSLAREDDCNDNPADAMDALPGRDGEAPSDTAEQNETVRCVQESIQSLPHDLKTVVLLFEYEDLSYEEIAGTLSCSPKAVETRLYRARKILREKLERLLFR